MTTLSKIGPKEFIFRVLSGVAVGIVAGLVPNAILGEIFKYLMQFHPIFKTLLGVVQAIQFTVPALVGALIALKFNLTPLAMAVVASASYVGSGAAQFKNGTWVIAGIGDLINTMITASIAVLLILLIEHRVEEYGVNRISNNCRWYFSNYRCVDTSICTYDYYWYW